MKFSDFCRFSRCAKELLVMVDSPHHAWKIVERILLIFKYDSKLQNDQIFRSGRESNKIVRYLFSLGLMVQKGKFSAATALLVRTLKKVDFPTFGTPTMPTFRFVPTRPIRGFLSGSSTFLGAIPGRQRIKVSFTSETALTRENDHRSAYRCWFSAGRPIKLLALTRINYRFATY